MWAGMLHLVLGNALIGLGEGLLLSWWFKTPKIKSILVLIAANYVSAWLGSLLFTRKFSSWVDPTIETISGWFWIFVIATFLLTMLVELPFFRFALRHAPNPLKRSVKASFFINALSYALLFGWYWNASRASLMTDVEVVSASELSLPPGHELYYVSVNGTEIIRADLQGRSPERVRAVKASHDDDRLFAQANSRSGFDLFIRLHGEGDPQYRSEIVLENFSALAPIDARREGPYDERVDGTWFNFGVVPKIASQGDWEYRTGFWSAEGIEGESKQQQSRFRFAMEIPIAAWSIRNATQIEGNGVIFQLGRDQICALHPQTKRIALLARGKGPIVVKSSSVPLPE